MTTMGFIYYYYYFFIIIILIIIYIFYLLYILLLFIYILYILMMMMDLRVHELMPEDYAYFHRTHIVHYSWLEGVSFLLCQKIPRKLEGQRKRPVKKEEVAIDVAQENNAETPQEDAPENSEEQPQSEVKAGIASESGEVKEESENNIQQKSAYVVGENVADKPDVANPDKDVVDPGANSEEAQEKVYTDTRLDDLLGSYNSEFDESKPETRCAISFEYYPPRTTESLKNLYEKIERMKTQKPLYCSVTWGAGGSTAKVSLDIAKVLKGKFEIVPNLHLTCTNMEKHIIKETLDDCRLLKIKNVMALRGEEAKESSEDEATEFSSAIDLIRYMRENYEEHEFCIQTAGYPEGHGTKINKIDNPKMLTENEKKGLCTVQTLITYATRKSISRRLII